MTPFEEVLEDLRAEQAALDSVLVRLPEEAWERDTHAPGWKVRDQVAHLTYFDEAATRALEDANAFREETARTMANTAGRGPDYLDEARSRSSAELLRRWRESSRRLTEAAAAANPKARLPWYGPDMSAVSFITARLMETWSHGLDIVDVVGIDRPPTDRLRHVVFLGVRTRQFSYINRGLQPNEDPVYVELRSPSGDTWSFGEPGASSRISGPAEDFAAVVTQRRHLADTSLVVDGAAALEWMAVAQAFAGPPGQGRKPGEFPRKQ